MKLQHLLTMSLALSIGLNRTANSDEPLYDPVSHPVPLDIAYEQYLELQDVADALRAEDAAKLVDLAIQMAEAERVLLRTHRSELSASDVLSKAAQLAAKAGDKDALEVLTGFAERTNNNALLGEIQSASKLSSSSRAVEPTVTVSINAEAIGRLGDLQEWMTFVDGREKTGDQESLVAAREAIDASTQLAEPHKEILKTKLESSLAAVKVFDAESSLSRLTAAGRGWDPKKTIGKIAEGDIVGAISGADFRIPANETGFTGNSGRRWTMVYTLRNDTPYQVSVQFVQSGNTSSLPPGKQITCRSKASAWGNEKTGVQYTYPKVKAQASNGKTWLRTISRDGEDYRIIRRSDGSIQIVP